MRSPPSIRVVPPAYERRTLSRDAELACPTKIPPQSPRFAVRVPLAWRYPRFRPYRTEYRLGQSMTTGNSAVPSAINEPPVRTFDSRSLRLDDDAAIHHQAAIESRSNFDCEWHKRCTGLGTVVHKGRTYSVNLCYKRIGATTSSITSVGSV